MVSSTTATKRYRELPPLDPEIVALLPEQGAWSEGDYRWLTDRTNRLVEYTDGY